MYLDIYGISKTTATPRKNGSTTNGTQLAAKRANTSHRLEMKDSNIIGQVLDQLEYEVVSENIRSYNILGTTIEIISWT